MNYGDGDSEREIEVAIAVLNAAWADCPPRARTVWSRRAAASTEPTWQAWARWVGGQVEERRAYRKPYYRQPPARDPREVERYKQRAEAMAAAYETGRTLADIGTEHGVSRERVRQILKDYGTDMGWHIRQERAERNREIALTRAMKPVREWLQANGPAPRNELLELFPELTTQQIGEGISKGMLPKHLVLGNARSTEMPGFEESVAAVRRAWLRSGRARLSSQRYGRLRDPGDPGPLYIVNRWSWAAVCEAAGMGPQGGLRRGTRPIWTDEDVMDWVARYMAWTQENDRGPSFAGYEEWSRETDGAPSGSTVRNRLQVHLQMGTWPEVLRAVAARNTEKSMVTDLSSEVIGDTVSTYDKGRHEATQGSTTS